MKSLLPGSSRKSSTQNGWIVLNLVLILDENLMGIWCAQRAQTCDLGTTRRLRGLLSAGYA